MSTTTADSTLGISRRNEVLWNGEVVGTVERVAHNTYAARNLAGEIVVPNAYANGGAKHSAGFHLVLRLGLVADRTTYIHVDHNGSRIHGGPWTIILSNFDPKGE